MREPKGPHDEDRRDENREDRSADVTELDATVPMQAPVQAGRFVADGPNDSPGGQFPAPGEDFGPFQILRSLGSGGMGQVYMARRRDTGAEVALKLLHQRLDQTERARFLREGRLAATVSHPNSVYVYGVEEVEGVPVIAMELVSGCSLGELVTSDGPLEPARAVDMVLQLADGLEAAAEQGLLHRDIKPANCFVAQDDTCKIGDYGLSRSLSDDEDTQLTRTGTFLGTPAFASPEQLRAEKLGKRSDIYSLGATLYYLLTGQAPFTASNFARLVYDIQQQEPKSPADIREGIPTGLGRVVLHCLAKEPVGRYQDYGELRAALRPFSSEVVALASLRQRLAGGVIDRLALLVAGFLVFFVFFEALRVGAILEAVGEGDGEAPVWAFAVIEMLYFTLLEGRWGASLGKYLMRIRVEVPGRPRPGVARASARAALFVLASTLFLAMEGSDAGILVSVGFYFLLLAGLFATARGHDGWAGLHDLASGTRVVQYRASLRRARSSDEATTAARPHADAIEHLGPYEVVEELQSTAAETLLRARDQALGRELWIRRFAEPVASLPGWRKAMARAGRLRWVHGVRDDGTSWDAYQAVPGETFGEATCGPRDWTVARQWAVDVAREIEACVESTEPTELGIDRVWIGKDGRARLLEFSMGEQEPGPGIEATADLGASQSFLLELLERTLHATAPGGAEPKKPGQASVHVPSRVQAVLDKLRRKAYGSLADFVAEFEALEAGPTEITRRRRLVPIAATLAASSINLVPGLAVALPEVILSWRDPEAATMLHYLDYLHGHQEATERSGEEIAAFERYVAGRFQGRLLSELAWNSGAVWASEANGQLAQRLHDEYPRLDPSLVAQAEQQASALIEPVRIGTTYPRLRALSVLALSFAITGLGVIAVLGLVAALVVRGGPMLRVARIAVVDERYRPVGRGRWLLRSLIVWSPGIGGLSIMALLRMLPDEVRWSSTAQLLTITLVVAVCLIYSVGAVLAVRDPQRGPADRLAGTRLVPR